MEPIISPWIIYAVSLAGKINIIASIIATILGICMLLFYAVHFLDPSFLDDSNTARGFIKKACIPFVVCLAILVFVPDERTMMSMIVVQYVTPDNISAVQGNVVDFVGQIVQVVKGNIK